MSSANEQLRAAGIIAEPVAGTIRTAPLDVDECVAVMRSRRWRVEVDEASGCHVWLTALTGAGYGTTSISGRTCTVHRVAFVAFLGRDLAPGAVLDHLCRNRACCNPEHLIETTMRGNTTAPGSLSLAALKALQTRCTAGHSIMDPQNLVRSEARRGRRKCLACVKERDLLRAQAALALGMTQAEYRAEYDQGRATAERILAEQHAT